MKLKTFALALAATTIAGAAFAADLPSRKIAPVMAPVPVFTWSGFYLGVNAGVGWNAGGGQNGAQTFLGVGSNGAPIGSGVPGGTAAWNNGLSSPIGALGGLTVGYNMQLSPMFVAGLEADIQLASIRGNGTAATTVPVGVNGIVVHNGAISVSQKTDWFGTLRGRIGVTPFAPTFLLYATGGLAYGNVKTSFAMADVFPTVPAILGNAITGSTTKLGWTAGAGAEWAITQNWSLKGEWLYVDLGRTTLTGVNSEFVGPAPFPLYTTSQSYKNNFHVVRLGLNYRFGGGAGPVVAKY